MDIQLEGVEIEGKGVYFHLEEAYSNIYMHIYVCIYIYIYIYIYVYIYIYGQYAHFPPPHTWPTGALWGKVRYPPPYFGVGKHKKTCFRSELDGY